MSKPSLADAAKTASLTLNRATDTTRQPGSTFKLVSTYAPALNEMGMSLATTYEDEPYFYPDGAPVNNSSRSYGGRPPPSAEPFRTLSIPWQYSVWKM